MNLDHPNSNYFFPNPIPQQHQDHRYRMIASSNSAEAPVMAAASSSLGMSLLYCLSLLKDRVHQVQSLVGVLATPDLACHEPVDLSLAATTIGNLIQEIKGTATAMMFYCQQLNLSQTPSVGNFSIEATAEKSSPGGQSRPGEGVSHSGATNGKIDSKGSDNFEIIELDVTDLLAKYTHFCHICGKGFKRDANLRMHMRAHGDEYKTSAALSKPLKNNDNDQGPENWNRRPKYSCPQEGCRWNRNHPRFQPLKSMICMKNHYKRSHCPKMYVCKRCNGKRFSVMSDLRTHEKHCGEAAEWRCTCGTTFSRKDKLMGHVNLFVGHAPEMRIGKAYDW